jgi:hypothetical protein
MYLEIISRKDIQINSQKIDFLEEIYSNVVLLNPSANSTKPMQQRIT